MLEDEDSSKDASDEEKEAVLPAEDVSWRDYVAIVLAMAQTVLLPFLLASAVLLLLFILSIYLT